MSNKYPTIQLRTPSEKPTREDGDKDGRVFVLFIGECSKSVLSTEWCWSEAMPTTTVYWFSLPDGLLPREPTQEERWRAEFEEKFNSKYPDGSYKEAAWQGFLAAKEGGAE